MTLSDRGLTVRQAVQLMAAGELTSEELVRAYLERIAAKEPALKAFAYFDAEAVLAAARRCDSLQVSGNLHGIPIALKDVFDTRDMPTEYNSPIYRHHQPRSDAACVRRLREAGAIILGKTVTSEFAHSVLGATVNPVNPAHSPGGSSSGSAAAVAADLTPLALGTQTGGSTIRPASYCGVPGFKPTFGRISLDGVKALAPSLDTAGLFARNIEDIALLFGVMTGDEEKVPPDRAAPRIALCAPSFWGEAAQSSKNALAAAAQVMSSSGCTISTFELPSAFESLPQLASMTIEAEMSRSLREEYAHHRELLAPQTRKAIESGLALPEGRLEQAYRLRGECCAILENCFEKFDALLTFSAPGEAPAGNENGSAVFNSAWTMLGVPCLNIPGSVGPEGLPVGVQLIGRRDADAALLRLASRYMAFTRH
jgi:Asp-tRNA(Asn)/Glu-tRNA(Gln) amidotransferase A subunit family amidase